MRWTSIKEGEKIVLVGVEIEATWEDGSLKVIDLKNSEGDMLRISKSKYSMSVAKPTPPKMVKRYVLKGTVAGTPIQERLFKTRGEATNAAHEIDCADWVWEIEEREIEEGSETCEP